jgi:heme/copper-type cytochrome/quinol oxidase subunit 3
VTSAATTYDLGSARSNGWWGMVVFVFGETTLFLMLFATYFYLRLQSTHWPPRGVDKPPVLVPVLLTAALVATSFAMQRAWSNGRLLRRARAWTWLAVAGVVQAAYLIWQVHDFVAATHEEPPSHSAYASIHLTMLAVDHLHVFLGVLLTAWLLIRLATRITPYRLRGLQAITFYWHAVNAITLAVLLVGLSPYLG